MTRGSDFRSAYVDLGSEWQSGLQDTPLVDTVATFLTRSVKLGANTQVRPVALSMAFVAESIQIAKRRGLFILKKPSGFPQTEFVRATLGHPSQTRDRHPTKLIRDQKATY